MRICALAALALSLAPLSAGAQDSPHRDSATVLAQSPAADWRPLDPERTLYIDLPAGRVVIELAASFAPLHGANIRTLVREHYFDGLWIERAQDNYVVQWGDPDAKKSLGSAKPAIAAEFSRPIAPGDHFTALPDPDTYAQHTGFLDGFPVGWDTRTGQTWMTHCYGMVGVGRDVDPTSGSGSELYAVIGQSPRHLDRNVTLIGKVVKGVELLSVMPRGTEAMGFYARPEQRTTIAAIRFASDVPPAEREKLEELRTDSHSFTDWIAAKRTRTEDWFHDPAGHIEVCNAPVPVRAAK